jgi:endonuclease I
LVTTTATSSAAPTGLELFKGEAERAVVRGLAVLQERREGDYLDPPATRADDIAEYYGDLPAEVEADTLSPAELYDALHDRISEAGGLTIARAFPDHLESLETLHRSALEGLGLESGLVLEDAKYDRSRAHLYTWIDLHPDRMLHCIYTGALIAPEQLLLKDLLTDLDLRDDMPRSFRNNQFLNCEHVVPQSWFDKEPVAKADLHHLFTAHGTANNFRSDSVYQALQGNPAAAIGPENAPAYVGPAGLKATGPKRFEPFVSSRPIVARATLYFLIAHRGKVDDSKVDAEQVALLTEWSNLAEPGEYELHRNQAIFEVQGNRNPLIDFPDWVGHLDFMRGIPGGG